MLSAQLIQGAFPEATAHIFIPNPVLRPAPGRAFLCGYFSSSAMMPANRALRAAKPGTLANHFLYFSWVVM